MRDTCELNVRILELPSVPMLRSGANMLEPFGEWATGLMAEADSPLAASDLYMWFNARLNSFEWLLTLPAALADTHGYAVFQFPGGLYAVAACRDEGPEIERTNRHIHDWVAQSEFFAEDDSQPGPAERYDMGIIITPPTAKAQMGFEQMDLYIPIVPKTR